MLKHSVSCVDEMQSLPYSFHYPSCGSLIKMYVKPGFLSVTTTERKAQLYWKMPYEFTNSSVIKEEFYIGQISPPFGPFKEETFIFFLLP